jgi:hypothetical protein
MSAMIPPMGRQKMFKRPKMEARYPASIQPREGWALKMSLPRFESTASSKPNEVMLWRVYEGTAGQVFVEREGNTAIGATY